MIKSALLLVVSALLGIAALRAPGRPEMAPSLRVERILVNGQLVKAEPISPRHGQYQIQLDLKEMEPDAKGSTRVWLVGGNHPELLFHESFQVTGTQGQVMRTVKPPSQSQVRRIVIRVEDLRGNGETRSFEVAPYEPRKPAQKPARSMSLWSGLIERP